MMNSTNNPRRSAKRSLGLGLAALSMSLLGVEAKADNLTALTSYHLPVNSGMYNFVAVAGDTKYFFAHLFANRSYELIAYPIAIKYDCPTAGSAAVYGISASMDDTFTTGLLSVSGSNSGLEGSPGVGVSCNVAHSARFTATASGVYFIKALTVYGTGNVYFILRETTLFSPWLSRVSGYQGFCELHNNTSASVTVTLRAYDGTGALQGAGLSFSIPANATVFKTGTEIFAPTTGAVGVTLTHDGALGAISGNITTLNPATGLSFDSPFAPRTDYVRMH